MDAILQGLAQAFTPLTLGFVLFGVVLGIAVGAIPGLSSPMAIAIAVPLTFYMTPLAAIAFLLGVNKGGEFGGSISAILLNTPGTPEAAATALDGHPLAQQGKAGKALKTALYSSVAGDTFSDIVLILVAAPLAVIALKMGPPELLGVLIFAFTFVTALLGNSMIKGLIAAALGVLLSLIGIDPEAAIPRLTFDVLELEDGLSFAGVAIGLLAFSEVITQIERSFMAEDGAGEASVGFSKVREDNAFTRADFRQVRGTVARSAVIGTVIGAIPGLGTSLAGFLGYGAAMKASKHPEEFGKGRLEGVAATEAANSAVVGSNLIPLLTLGIPGNVAAALLAGAFLIHGITPGPLIFQDHAALVYGMFGCLIVANLMNLLVGSVGLRLFSLAVRTPRTVVMPSVALLCITGSFIAGGGLFAVATMMVFGVLGYLMRKLDFSIIAFILGFILGPMVERSLRHTVILFEDASDILGHPFLIAMLVVSAGAAFWFGRRPRRRPAE